MDKRLEEEELQVTDWDILMGFVASGVEPRGIKLVDNFWDNYKKIYDEEFNKNGFVKLNINFKPEVDFIKKNKYSITKLILKSYVFLSC